MIKIYLLDFSGADADGVYRTALPSYIENTQNAVLKRERIFSFLLLSYAYEKSFPLPMPKIEKDEYGRPYFPDSNIDFNISHDGKFVAVAITDVGRVGIDVQLYKDDISERLIRKTSELYNEKIAYLSENGEKIEAEIELLKYCDDCGIIKAVPGENTVSDSESKSDFFRRWTEIEAISKADGKGVALFSKIDFEKDSISMKSAKIKYGSGESYALAVAFKKI